jgi:hypothetical protein
VSGYPNNVLSAGSVAISSLADPGAGKVIGSSGGAAAAVLPPGFEIGYDEITTGVSIASSSAATPTTLITCAAHTFDGAPVVLEVFSAIVFLGSGSNGTVSVALWEGIAQIGLLAQIEGPSVGTGGSGPSMLGKYRFTPSAGAHTYVIRGFASSLTGTPSFNAGSGGTGANSYLPAFARFTKV